MWYTGSSKGCWAWLRPAATRYNTSANQQGSHDMAGKKLQGQVAIITGAGRGIGAATAQRLAAAGAAVVLTARTEEEIEAVAKHLRQQGGRAIAVAGDVSDLAAVEEIVESALEQFERVDVLINAVAFAV